MQARTLAQRVDGVNHKYGELTKRYGYGKPPAAEAKSFREEVTQLVSDIRESKDEEQIRLLDDMIVDLDKNLLPGYGYLEKIKGLSPFALAGGVIGWGVGAYTEPTGLSHYQSYMYKRNSAICGAGAGAAIAGLFSRSKMKAIDDGVKFYNELLGSLANVINERKPRHIRPGQTERY